MQIFHYNNQFDSKPLHNLMSEFGETVTDTSKWRPELSLIHAESAGNMNKRLIYDFPDGVDTGETVQTFVRNPSLDVTEIDTALNASIADAKQKQKDAKDKEHAKNKRAEETKEYLDQVKETFKDSDYKTSDKATE